MGEYIKTSAIILVVGGVAYYLNYKYHWYDKAVWAVKKTMFKMALNSGRNALRKHVKDVYIDRDSGYIYDAAGNRIGREIF